MENGEFEFWIFPLKTLRSVRDRTGILRTRGQDNNK